MVGRPGSERMRVMASDFAAEGISGEESRGRMNDIVDYNLRLLCGVEMDMGRCGADRCGLRVEAGGVHVVQGILLSLLIYPSAPR